MALRPTAGMLTQNSTKPVGLPSAALPPTIAEEEVFSDTDSFVTSQNKPAPETKNTPAAPPAATPAATPAAPPAATPAAESDREYRYVKEARDLSGGRSRNIWDATKVGVARGDAGLKELYDSRKEYTQLFDSFDSFKSYMNEIQDLYDSETLSPWYKTQSIREWTDAEYGEGTYDEIREEASAAEAFGEQDTGVARLRDDYEAAMAPIREEQFKAFIASPEYQGLSQKYGLNDVVKNQDGDVFAFNGGWPVEIFEVDDHLGAGDYVKIAVAIGLGAALGPAIGSTLTGTATGTTAAAAGGAAATTTGTFVQGAVNSVIGSAISQGVATGSVDASSLATAAVLGGIGGVAEGIKTGELAGTTASDAIDGLSELTGLATTDTVNIVEGVITGAVTGEDLEDIAVGAVQGFTSGQIKNVLNETFGDEVDIENVFDEGTTTIPTSSLDPFVETAVNAAFEGEIEAEDVLESLVDYAQEGGSFGFLDPGLDLPDIDLDLFGNAQPFDFGDTPEEIKAIEDAVRAAGSATEDVVRAVGSTAEDVVRAGGQVLAPIVEPPAQAIGDVLATAEDIVRPIGSAAEDVVRAVGSTAEDIVRPIGSAAEDVVRTVGSAADDYIIQPIREAIPEVTAPDINVDLPEIDIALPEVNLPSVDLPSIDLPSIDFGMPQLAGGGGMFDPYSTNIGYSPVQLQQLITSPYGVQQPALKDYELAMNGILARNSGMMS